MPYNPSDPVLGADMTQGEWDQLRELMRKAEAGGKMNELLTVHKKEVKNAPMNRPYPPEDDDWKDCMESHVPPSPSKVHAPTGSNSSAAPPGALWPDAYSQNAYKVPPTTPPPTLQAGGNSGIVDSMHVNTTRNGKTGHMIPMTTLGLRMMSKTQRMTSL